MMKSTNTSSTVSKPEYVKFENITEVDLNARPEFFTSMANNPLQGRLDGTSVKQNYFKIIDIKSGTESAIAYTGGFGTYYGYALLIPFASINNYPHGKDLFVEGWTEDGTGNKVPMGNIGFYSNSGATNIYSYFTYFISERGIVVTFCDLATPLAATLKYKLFIMTY